MIITTKKEGRVRINDIAHACDILIRNMMFNEDTSPNDADKAKNIIAGIVGRDAQTINLKTVQSVLKSIEVASIKGLNGEKYVVTDPIHLQYRVAMQVKRDAQAMDLEIVISDIRKQVFLGVNNSEINFENINSLLRPLVETHLELEYGDFWKQKSSTLRDKVIAVIYEMIVKEIIANNRSMTDHASVIIPVIIEEEFLKEVE